MDRPEFQTRADRLRAYARELQAAVEDGVARATNLTSGESAGRHASSSADDASGASATLARICPTLEDLLVAYDQLQETIGGEPRYEPLLQQLQHRPLPGRSSPAPSD